jgi:hypothetical protein
MGDQTGVTIISTSSATANIFELSSSVTVRDMALTSSVTRTAGYHINMGSMLAYVFIERVQFTKFYHGVYVNSNYGAIRSCDFRGNNIASTTNGITVIQAADFVCDHCVMYGAQSGTQWNSGFLILNSAGMWLRNCEISQTGTGIWVAPNAVGLAVQALTIDSCFVNSCSGNGITLDPVASGTAIGQTLISDCWIGGGTGTGVGVYLDSNPAATGVLGTNITNCQVLQWASYGILINNAKVLGTAISNCAISGNLHGIVFNTSVVKFSVMSCMIGTASGGNANSNYGLYFVGTNSIGIIIGNILTGNTSGSIFGTLGASSIIKDNVGYNPVGGSSVTPGASTWTYTASPSPETHYISGGALTALSVSGQAIVYAPAGSTLELGPGESYVMGYTAAPTVHKVVH